MVELAIFVAAAGVLLAAALAFLLWPLLRGGGALGAPDSAVYRRQIAEIEADLEAGTLDAEEAELARTEAMRRLLTAADREASPAAAASAGPRRPWRLAVALGLAVSLGTIALYLVTGSPSTILADSMAPGAPATPEAAEVDRAVAALQARLARDPQSLEGGTLLARSLATLQRWPGAADAYRHALALAPADPALHAGLGEVLTLASGTVTPAAAAEFDRAGDAPQARYYRAMAAAQAGDLARARSELSSLLKASAPDAPWRPLVEARLAELGSRDAIPSAPAPGPAAADVAAAAKMNPAARNAMIRGMVDRLQRELEAHPQDPAGWARLARAYDVLGEPDKAAAARAHAAQN